MKNSIKSKSTLFYRALLILTMSIMLTSCSKTELPQPTENLEKESTSLTFLEGVYETSDDCTFWIEPENYSTEITAVEYNIIEISNVFNLVSPEGAKSTIHASVIDDKVIIPEQSYFEGRYVINGIGSISEDGQISIDIDLVDAHSGDPVQSCTLNLIK